MSEPPAAGQENRMDLKGHGLDRHALPVRGAFDPRTREDIDVGVAMSIA